MVDEELLFVKDTSSVTCRLRHMTPFPRWGRLTVVCTLDYGGGVCSKLLQSKSRQLEPLASPIWLLALVHTTRLTGGCDWYSNKPLVLPGERETSGVMNKMGEL